MATNPALVATTTLIAEERISARADEKASCGTAISHASLAWRARISIFWPELSSEGAREPPTSLICDGNFSSFRRREDDGKLGRWHR